MVKLGASYDSGLLGTWGMFYSYIAASTLQNAQATHFNSDPDSYNLLTLNWNGNLGNLTGNPPLNPFSLNLYLDNLLDETIYFPSMHQTSVSSIPHHAGRAFYLTLTAELP